MKALIKKGEIARFTIFGYLYTCSTKYQETVAMVALNTFVCFQCMGWTWYLANDMQFYILSPLILLPLF